MANNRFSKIAKLGDLDGESIATSIENNNHIKVKLFDITKYHKQWVEEKQKAAYENHYDHFTATINKDGNIEYLYEQMDDYHNCEYSHYFLTIELPLQIQILIQNIATDAQINLKHEFRKLLGL